MKKKILPYLITAILISAVFLVFCDLKQVSPFGPKTLECNDDFPDQMIPLYFHVYDALHGKASLFFEWRTGLGMNYAGAAAHYSLLSPFSLFFLFLRRSSIPYSMIWFILIKLIAMGCTMNYYLSHQPMLVRKPISLTLQILLSFLYAVNGYTMMYYGFGWMDVSIFAPLLILYADRILASRSATISSSERWYPFLLPLVLIRPEESDFTILVTGRKAVYLKIPGWSEIRISCNGKVLTFPSFEDLEKTKFPTPFQCGTIYLGVYQDETVNVAIQSADPDVSFTEEVQIGKLDLGKFEESTQNLPEVSYSADHSHLNVTVTAEDDGYLFLPVNADPGWFASSIRNEQISPRWKEAS